MAFKISSAVSAAANSSGGGGSYLNPSKIPSGGSVRFRILSEEPLCGFSLWAESADGAVKPFRFAAEPTPQDIDMELGPNFSRRMNREGTGPEPIKAFVAFLAYNLESGQVEICELTQKGLIKELDQICSMEEYQDTSEFDLILGKTGSGLGTEYSLRPVPAKKGLEDKIAELLKSKPIDITKLMVGESPFG